jgi:hypothetical protein
LRSATKSEAVTTDCSRSALTSFTGAEVMLTGYIDWNLIEEHDCECD